jgi:hypothetical protein
MSDDSIPAPGDQHKPGIVRTGSFHVRIVAPLAQAIDATANILSVLRPGWDAPNDSAGVDRAPKPATPPRRPPPRPRRARTRSGTITPYKAKRAAMEDLELRRLRRDGFTPYFGEKKRFYMTPPEFDLVLACESRQVAQVIYEVLRQSVGYTGAGEHGRREWGALSKRHFERRGLMSQGQAERTLRYAVEQGYLLRRRLGRQRWEYALHYRQGDIVPR